MSIFHFSVKVISKGKGQSVVASASYRSGSKIEDKSTGIVHDYSRKTGVDDTLILLPENAPSSFLNREILWNSVTESEIKVKDAQLARELEFALPVEWSMHQRKEIVKEFIQKNFVDKGMCADIAWHDKGDGNPHVHVLLTMKELDANGEGKWQSKSTKKYLCRKPNEKEERYLDAHELKQSINAGFEKVYKFKPVEQDDNKKYITLTMSEFKEHYSESHVRISKAPLDKKVARNDWNDQGNVEKWREAWANMCNQHLEKEKHVDHRSFARRGMDVIPTIHEGPTSRKMEKAGYISERCATNREIKETNRLSRLISLHAKEIEKNVINTITNLGEAIYGQISKLAGAISKFIDDLSETKRNIGISKKRFNKLILQSAGDGFNDGQTGRHIHGTTLQSSQTDRIELGFIRRESVAAGIQQEIERTESEIIRIQQNTKRTESETDELAERIRNKLKIKAKNNWTRHIPSFEEINREEEVRPTFNPSRTTNYDRMNPKYISDECNLALRSVRVDWMDIWLQDPNFYNYKSFADWFDHNDVANSREWYDSLGAWAKYEVNKKIDELSNMNPVSSPKVRSTHEMYMVINEIDKLYLEFYDSDYDDFEYFAYNVYNLDKYLNSLKSKIKPSDLKKIQNYVASLDKQRPEPDGLGFDRNSKEESPNHDDWGVL